MDSRRRRSKTTDRLVRRAIAGIGICGIMATVIRMTSAGPSLLDVALLCVSFVLLAWAVSEELRAK